MMTVVVVVILDKKANLFRFFLNFGIIVLTKIVLVLYNDNSNSFRKKVVLLFMKRKIITQTYLRDVSKYQIKLYMDEDNCYISVKKLIKVDKKFIINNNLCVMDNGYYVVEVVPKYENYAMRLFLDNNKKPLEYYFDICKNNGLDPTSLVPFYDDLYLDITVLNEKVNILDEQELEQALELNDITDEDYKLTMNIKEKLLDAIKNKSNRFMNKDYSKYLF